MKYLLILLMSVSGSYSFANNNFNPRIFNIQPSVTIPNILEETTVLSQLPSYEQQLVQQAYAQLQKDKQTYTAELAPALKEVALQKQILELELSNALELGISSGTVQSNISALLQVVAEKQQMLNNLLITESQITNKLYLEFRKKIIAILSKWINYTISENQEIVDTIVNELLEPQTQTVDESFDYFYEFSNTNQNLINNSLSVEECLYYLKNKK